MKRWTQATRGTHFLWIPIPASSSVPFFVALLHIAWYTFLVAAIVFVFQLWMRAKGRSLLWVIRKFKHGLANKTIQARPLWYQRRMRRKDGFDLIDLDETEQI